MTIYQTLPSGIQLIEYEPAFAKSLADMWNESSEDWGGASALHTEAAIIQRHQNASHYNTFLAIDNLKLAG